MTRVTGLLGVRVEGVWVGLPVKVEGLWVGLGGGGRGSELTLLSVQAKFKAREEDSSHAAKQIYKKQVTCVTWVRGSAVGLGVGSQWGVTA